MVRRMLRKGLGVAFCGLALSLAACGMVGMRGKASEAIAGFLAVVQRGDQQAFEAALDRPALRADLSGQIADLGKSRAVDVGGASEFVLDRMVNLQSVRLAAARVAPGWPAAPTAAQIIPRMRVIDRRHVCLEEAASKKCLLIFTREDDRWRLTGLRLAPPTDTTAAPS
jgi:hypothetical protein